MRSIFQCMFAAVVVWVGGAAVQAQQGPAKDLVRASLLSESAGVLAGAAFRIGVLLQIQPGWHVYWLNPGDGGIPTTIDLKLPEGFTASAWQYPTPRRFEQSGGLIAYGYEDEVMLIATITPPAKIQGSSVTIQADANWLVCEKVCVPGDAKLSLTLPVKPDVTQTEYSSFGTWIRALPTPIEKSQEVSRYHVQSSPPRDSSAAGKVTITIEWSGGAPADVQWFPPASQALNFKNIRAATQGRTTTITADVERLAGQQIEAALPDSVVGYPAQGHKRGLAVQVQFR